MTKVFKVCYYLFAILSGMGVLTLIVESFQESFKRQASITLGDSNTKDQNDFIGLIVFIMLAILFKSLWDRSRKNNSELEETK